LAPTLLTPPPIPTPAPQPALPIDDVIGQMFVAGVGGTEITPGLRGLILNDRIGGVILFRGNFIDAPGLARWSAQLQELGREAHLPAPLQIAIDEEGGQVNHLDSGIPLLPSAQTLGTRGPAGVRSAVAATATGLRSLGVTLDLAPVADLRTNPADAVIGDRSFGSEAATVGPLVSAYVGGLHDGGVCATVKHFPGLGGAAGDPHRALPTDSVTLATWLKTSALSFAAGIAAGADAVMTTAVRMPNLDPSNRPAVLSRPIVTGLLRERLGFGGVIVTDSLVLKGLGEVEGAPEASVDAIKAGNDLLLIPAGSDSALQERSVLAVRAAVASGSIPEAQVRASAARVMAMRARYAPPAPSPHPRVHVGDRVFASPAPAARRRPR